LLSGTLTLDTAAEINELFQAFQAVASISSKSSRPSREVGARSSFGNPDGNLVLFAA
jgi:hypothetical protein